jgi:hypothetical protein
MISRVPATKLPAERDVAGTGKHPVLAAALVALVAAFVCFGWLYFNVHYLYKGNWTSVYYSGALRATPPELASENIYKFPGVVGYDGQLYHLVAHDPLFQRGLDRFVDMPRIRYRRILVPGLAALLSFGHGNWVDPAYILVALLSIYLGTFWLARWSASRGFSPAWGFLFLLAPSALLTTLLMVVDGALAALTVGFFWYSQRQSPLKLFLVLACAALARETGVILIGGYCLWLLFQREFARAFIFGTSAIPAVLWFGFVQLHTKLNNFEYFSFIPLIGIYLGIVNRYIYKQTILLVLDYVAIGGILLAFAFVTYYAVRRQTWNSGTFMAAGFLLFAIFLGNLDIWREVNSFARVCTPLLLFLVTVGMSRGNWWTLAPMALIDLRIGAIFVYHAGLIVHAIVSKRA